MPNKLPKQFITSAKKCNLDTALMQQAGIPHVYVESHRILSVQKNPDLRLSVTSSAEGIHLKLVVKKGAKIKKPIFLCFGVLGQKEKQIILPEIILEEGAEAKILAHCTFPQAKNVLHQMDAHIKLGKNSKLIYRENHYHGESFGAEVLANFDIQIGVAATFENDFVLDQGSVGKLKINLETRLAQDAFCFINSKVIGKGKKDKIEISDKVSLLEENARSLVRLRGAVMNGGSMFFKGETEAFAKNNRGHIDCQEIIVGHSLAQSIPIILVKHPEARITHEASVGKVNQKQLETLMAHGLSEKEAIDFIIRGVIK
jgi:Fe-S cluster assembly scaffold protein SufB